MSAAAPAAAPSQPQPQPHQHHGAISEADMGIVTYANAAPGFAAVLKQRYSDFIVNEVGRDGQVVRLTRLQPPPSSTPPAAAAEGEGGDVNAKRVRVEGQESVAAVAVNKEEGKEAAPAPMLLTMAERAQKAVEELGAAGGWDEGTRARLTAEVVALLDPNSAEHATHSVILPPSDDKAIRRAQHQYVKKHFAGILEGDTVDAPGATTSDPSTGGIDASGLTTSDPSSSSGGVHAPPVSGALTSDPSSGGGTAAAAAAAGGGGGGGADGKAAGGAGGGGGGKKSVRLVRVGQGKGQGHWRGYVSHSGRQQQNKRGRDERGGGGVGGGGVGKGWYEDTTPKYLRFVLYKENHTTTSAVAGMAKQLRIKESRFSFAGMKDKRGMNDKPGLTTQACSAFRVRAQELLHKINIQGAGYLRLLVGNVEPTDDQLRLGGLGGNRFGIVLRNVEDGATDASIAEACQALGRSGFINYFGSQRFGTYGAPTSSIGVAILKRDWAGAVDLVLRPRAGEDQRCTDAREYYAETQDAKGALALMPRYMTIEVAVLRALDKHGSQAPLNALQAIPRNIQLMYLHAFQSEAWNKAATHRVQAYTIAHAVGGDLVYDDADEEETTTEGAKDGGGRRREKREVRLVTPEEEAAGSVDIGRVVLPLPGTSVQYPSHGTGELYKQVFAEKGLGMEALKNASQSDYTLGGDYRKLIARPLDFDWRLLRYADAAQRLLPTDVDRLPPEEKARLPGGHWQRFLGELKEEGDPEGPMRALCLEFTLPPSTYATMLLRELLKRSVTADEMKKLNPPKPLEEEEEGGGGGKEAAEEEEGAMEDGGD